MSFYSLEYEQKEANREESILIVPGMEIYLIEGKRKCFWEGLGPSSLCCGQCRQRNTPDTAWPWEQSQLDSQCQGPRLEPAGILLQRLVAERLALGGPQLGRPEPADDICS